MDTAFVTPVSKKAKNRFANLMESNDECMIEQIKGDNVFLASANKKHFFWASIHNDPHWQIDF